MPGKSTPQRAWGGVDKPKSTFLFLTIFPSNVLQTKDVNKTFKNQQEFWKLDKTWQNYYPLEHWRFGDEKRFVRFFLRFGDS